MPITFIDIVENTYRESMLQYMQLHELDKIKSFFIYCRFNISWIWSAILYIKIVFVLFKNALAWHQPKLFKLINSLSLRAYYDDHDDYIRQRGKKIL